MNRESSACLSCLRIVRKRQEALLCDGCNLWQHRVCGTGVSRAFYRQLVKGSVDLPQWRCCNCAPKVHTPVPPPSPPTLSPPPPQHAPADTENTSALANISTGCFVLGVSDDVEPDTSRLSPGQFESTRLSQARNDAADVDVGNVSMDTASSTDEFYYPDATYALQNTTDMEFTLPPLQAPRVVQEDSIADVTPQPNASETEDNGDPVYELLEDSSIRGKKKLYDNIGFSYTVKTRTASQIVTAVVNKHLGVVPCPNLPGMDYLARNGNYARQKARPRDPVDLDFSMQEQHIADGFLQRDIHGCAFHWGQAVWRKAQELGLRRAYLEDNATFMYVRKLMALPLLPAEHISPVFAVLERKARAEPLEALVAYIKETWIISRMWPPTSWSVFGQSNDVEGWHHGFNTKAKQQMPFYQLTSQLYEEAAQVGNSTL
ncbi:hypothetical protein LSAT2_016769 [Lamellibrachia satsuma]|nr:hypothetical protein LSAT2_016769 [Lamellibrachia satsuma]